MKKIIAKAISRLGSFLRKTFRLANREMDMGLIWALLFAALIIYGSKLIEYEGEKKAPVETKIVE